MKPIKYLLLVSMASLTLASFHPTTPAMALSATSTVDARIRLDWEVGTRFGRPVIQGYIYNDYLRASLQRAALRRGAARPGNGGRSMIAVMRLVLQGRAAHAPAT